METQILPRLQFSLTNMGSGALLSHNIPLSSVQNALILTVRKFDCQMRVDMKLRKI